MSRKKEKLALAQLNLRQLTIQQQLDEGEQEIRRRKELLEAQIKAEKAAVSLKVYEDEIEEQLGGTMFSKYLEPSAQRNENPCSTSDLNVANQTAPLELPSLTIATSAPLIEKSTFLSSTIEAVPIVPTPTSTVSLSNPTVGSANRAYSCFMEIAVHAIY